MKFTIQEVDYHRNGVSGEGFYIGIITDHDNDDRRMLITWFPEYSDSYTETLATTQTRVSVIDLDAAHAGNIYMFTTGDHAGGNAWRGDHYQDAARALMAKVRADFDSRHGIVS